VMKTFMPHAGCIGATGCGCPACGSPETHDNGSALSRRQALGAMAATLAGAGLIATGPRRYAASPELRWPSTGVTPPHRDCVIEAGAAVIWENDAPVLRHNVFIRVRDDRIVEVGTGDVAGDVARVDARKHLVLPGLISAHTHVSVG